MDESIRVIYVQTDRDNYTLARFHGMDEMRERMAAEHRVRIGRNVDIGREALIADGVTIGDNTVIEREATIENDARIGRNVRIGRDAFIDKASRIGDGTTIGEKTEIGRGVTVGDIVRIAAECVVHDRVNIGWSSQLGEKSKIREESVLGHHTVVGREAHLGRMVQTAPGTTIGSHRSVLSFSRIAGTDRNLYQDKDLVKHYARTDWAASMGGERKLSEAPRIQETPEQSVSRGFRL